MKKWEDHIETNPEILYGKPVIKGTRIPVELLLEKMSYGLSYQEIMESYPDLEKDDLLACLSCASLLLKNEVTIPLDCR